MITKDTYTYSLSIFSLVWSIDNINTILGILLTVLSVLNLLWTTGSKIYHAIKDKKYSDVSQILNDTEKEIKDLQEEINDNR